MALRLAQFSDTHENGLEKIVAKTARAQKIGVLCVGDILDAGNTKNPQNPSGILGKIVDYLMETAPDQQLTAEAINKATELDQIKSMTTEHAKKVYSQFQKTFDGIELYIDPGNHDTKDIYDIKGATFVNRVVGNYNGLKIAGSMNTVDLPIAISKSLSAIDLNDDINGTQVLQQLQQEIASSPQFKDLSQEEKMEIINQNLSRISQESSVYKRLKAEDINVYVGHSGFSKTNLLDNGQPTTIGLGFNAIGQQLKKGSLVACGHIHSGYADQMDGIPHFRSAPNVFYIHSFDEKTKQWLHTDVYEVHNSALKYAA